MSFRTSAGLMAARLRLMERLQQQFKDQGCTGEVTLHVEELFEAGDRAALAAFEQDCLLHSGAQPLPFDAEPSAAIPGGQ